MIGNNHIERTSLLSGAIYLHDLISNEGISYKEFRKVLNLDQRMLLRNMLLPWLFIMVPLIIFLALKNHFWWSILFIFPSSIWIAFWMHAYTCHFHEAAHFNIHPNRVMNDLVADMFLTPFIGLRVKDYRVTHWKHHRFLGLTNDTETSYHNPIDFTQILEGITGLYLFKTTLRYFKNFSDIDSKNAEKGTKSSAFVWSLSIMLITQSLIVIALYFFISFSASLSWIASVLVTGPFLARLRQTLEHRSSKAERGTDYSLIEHGPVNRIFGTDFVSKYFGAAGFNRHLLHHCDPSISYTRFDELELFLLKTSAKDFIEASRTTYLKTFFILDKR